jgi:hypothetical protein
MKKNSSIKNKTTKNAIQNEPKSLMALFQYDFYENLPEDRPLISAYFFKDASPIMTKEIKKLFLNNV